MTPRQVALIQQSWRAAEPIADTVVRLFYRRLFQRAPELRDRVESSMSEQGDCLRRSAEELVSGLAGAEPASREARENAGLIADAWTWTLRQEVGESIGAETTQAWRKALLTDRARDFLAVAEGESLLVA